MQLMSNREFPRVCHTKFKMSSPNIHLYTAQSPNGHKISITLEELGLPYEFTAVNMAGIAHKEPWFLAINPNGRIPAMTDSVDGEQVSLFESGSIQMYLIDRYDQERKLSYPKGSKEWYQTINWVGHCPNLPPVRHQPANAFANVWKALFPKCRSRSHARPGKSLRSILHGFRAHSLRRRSL
jgi:glutathione S-transferase